MEGDNMLRILVDDISVAIRGRDGIQLILLANRLLRILIRALAAIGLPHSAAMCKNFMMHALGRALSLFKRGRPTTRRMRAKDTTRYRTLRALASAESEKGVQHGGSSLHTRATLNY